MLVRPSSPFLFASIASLGIAVSGCGPPSVHTDEKQRITEASLLEYASKPYDKDPLQFTKIPLGSLHGTPVIVEHMCSDICPDYTIRIIHLALTDPRATCESVGGIRKTLQVPTGPGTSPRDFCIPRILVEHWDEIIQ